MIMRFSLLTRMKVNQKIYVQFWRNFYIPIYFGSARIFFDVLIQVSLLKNL